MKDKEKVFSLEAAEDSSGFLLWQVTNLWQREIRKALEKLNLTHTQFVLLASMLWLQYQKVEVTQIILSSHTKIDPMTTSTVLRALQTKDLIKRKEHNTDTRAKLIELTETGQKIAKQAVKKVEKFDKEFFSALQGKEVEFNKQLIALLSNGTQKA